ncbi:hypothetical protein JW921_02930 [Candidatus Fermentibacterales bacterium]|nr:hypothetical protein [Candidatus Fermentibacterales bacterium]
MRALLVCTLLVPALAMAQAVIKTIDAPDTNVSGLAWSDSDMLWAVDETTDYVYEVDPDDGSVLSSFYFAHSSTYVPNGLAYGQNLVYVAAWNNGTTAYIYKYTPGGAYQGMVSMCGG